MTKLLIKLFVRDITQTPDPNLRGRYGKLAGGVGIASNLLLFLAKLAIGLLSGSISIIADALNNLSDCASSVITLAGFKLAGRPADEEHPYGHARFEYISGLVVSFFILFVGTQLLKSSFTKALNPEPVEFSALMFVVLALSVLIKLWQGLFYRKLGKLIGSGTLTATATDSINDVVTTAAVLTAAVFTHYTGWMRMDGIMGMLVAVFILISGVKLVKETLDPLLGTAPDAEVVRAIESKLLEYPSVLGIHDLVIHSYGPGRIFASVHVEVPANQDILVSHDILDNMERDFSCEMNIDLVAHLDPLVTDDARVTELAAFVARSAREIDPVLSIHDFRMVEGKTHTNCIFDITVPPRFRLGDAELRRLLEQRLRELEGQYHCIIKVDRSYTSTTNYTKDKKRGV